MQCCRMVVLWCLGPWELDRVYLNWPNHYCTLNCTVFYCMQDPTSVIPGGYDLVLTKDLSHGDKGSQICTCLLHMRPSVTVLEFIDDWLAEIATHSRKQGSHDQVWLKMAEMDEVYPKTKEFQAWAGIIEAEVIWEGEVEEGDTFMCMKKASHVRYFEAYRW